MCNQEIKSHEENRTANAPDKGKLKHQLLGKKWVWCLLNGIFNDLESFIIQELYYTAQNNTQDFQINYLWVKRGNKYVLFPSRAHASCGSAPWIHGLGSWLHGKQSLLCNKLLWIILSWQHSHNIGFTVFGLTLQIAVTGNRQMLVGLCHVEGSKQFGREMKLFRD